MTAGVDTVPLGEEYPRLGDLRQLMDEQPVPIIPPGTVDLASMDGDAATKQAAAIVEAFNKALAADDAQALESLFLAEQAYWKDQLSLTYHLRTFNTPGVITAGIFETTKLRGLVDGFKLDGAVFIPATPVLQFIDCSLSFKTTSPAATSSGRILLLPVKKTSEDGSKVVQWKIWILSTKLENLDVHPEDESLLQAPGRSFEGEETIETDVFIIGGGNGGVALSARLKALGVESVVVDRNPLPGDNWALRYDCLKFHLPTSFCELPYITYAKEQQAPHLLTKDELAAHVRRFVEGFKINFIGSTKILSTKYNQSTKQWFVEFETPAGQRTAVAKQLVQATGIGSQKPFIPSITGESLYKGISVHSASFKNASTLSEQGAKSVIVIGSANTAFDVMEDCHLAGLQTTMNVRSPTYLVPLEYVCNPNSLGVYDVLGVEGADRLILTLPTRVDSQLARGLFRLLASQEPERYKALSATGFPVIDSSDPDMALMSNLIERCGGHYVDVGTTNLLVEGKAAFKANAEPVAYTETGLRFSDGSIVDADAIVWCTGFRDKDTRDTVAEILGGETYANGNGTNGNGASKDILGSHDIAARVDATWGVDAEGEIRGMWKRHLRIDNYWVMGGYTQQHRYYSRTLALQIKAALEGILPPAYRSTPEPSAKKQNGSA